MAIEIYETDDSTLVSDLEITTLAAGSDSDTITVHIWNNKGGGGQDEENLLLLLEVENPSVPGDYLRSGVAPQDELWGRVRLVGHDNTGDATQEPITTDWLPVGAYAGLVIANIHDDCARFLEIKMRPPAGASELSWRWKLTVLDSEHSLALPSALTQIDRGIIHGVGDFARSGIIRGGAVTETGTPDDEAQIAPAMWLWQGEIKGMVSTSEQLNQNDSAPAALAVGESYYAALTLGASGVTATKGTKDSSPTKPTPPAGELLLAWVTVTYEGGGTSLVETADIDEVHVYDRHNCVAGSGLEAIVHAGFSLGGGTWRFWSVTASVTLTASSTNYLYQLASGLWSAETSEVEPEATAIGPMWEVVTDGSGVTGITDRRKYAGKMRVLRLAGAPPGSPGEVQTISVEEEELHVEETVFRASDNGAGSSGSTDVEWFINGTTAFTSKATDDQRPGIAWDASTLVDRDGYHELTVLKKGDLIRFDTTANPVGGNPTDLELLLVCRVP